VKPKRWLIAWPIALAVTLTFTIADAQGPKPGGTKAPTANAGTAFTYQGQLKKNGALVTSSCSMAFDLYDAYSGGNHLAGPVNGSPNPATVTNGLFIVQVDFGNNVLTGSLGYLQIAVQCTGDGSATPLSRQQLAPAPIALALPGLYTQQNAWSPNVIGGYSGNSVASGMAGATIGGGGASGIANRVTVVFGVVGGGGLNQAGDNAGTKQYATVGGGSVNTASGTNSTVGGGYNNTASGDGSFVGGGGYDGANYYGGNQASGNASTVGGGYGNTASGDYAAVPGGAVNTAIGLYSFAAGRGAIAHSLGSFVWADAIGGMSYDPFSYPDPGGTVHSFNVRSTGGVYLVTAVNGVTGRPAAGVYVSSGGSGWNFYSDRDSKANLAAVNGRDVLKRLTSIPIQTWSYKTQDPSIRHIGPMAQDFHAAFTVGEDDKYINSIDTDGVALAAIQGLYAVVQEKDTKIAAQQKQIDSLEARVAALEQGAQVSTPGVHADDMNSMALIVIGGFLAFVVTQKPWQSGER
jgi:hypothetical protein